MAEGHGIDPATVFASAGLDASVIEQPRARYPFAKVCKAWTRLADLTNKPHLGLEAAKYYRVTDLEEYLREMENLGEEPQALAAHMRHLKQGHDMEAIIAILQDVQHG